MYNEFFMQHVIDQVQGEYDLSDEEMSKLIQYLEKFEADPKQALKRARKTRNKSNLDNIIRLVLNKEIANNAHKEFRDDPLPAQSGPLSVPMSLPLTLDMTIEPHKLYGGF